MNIKRELSTIRDAIAVATTKVASDPVSAVHESTAQVCEAPEEIRLDGSDFSTDDDLPLSDSGPETALCW